MADALVRHLRGEDLPGRGPTRLEPQDPGEASERMPHFRCELCSKMSNSRKVGMKEIAGRWLDRRGHRALLSDLCGLFFSRSVAGGIERLIIDAGMPVPITPERLLPARRSEESTDCVQSPRKRKLPLTARNAASLSYSLLLVT